MSEKVLVPVLGESINEATVVRWLKNTGDLVETDEPIVELETEKVNLSEYNEKISLGLLSHRFFLSLLRPECGFLESLKMVRGHSGKYFSVHFSFLPQNPFPSKKAQHGIAGPCLLLRNFLFIFQ